MTNLTLSVITAQERVKRQREIDLENIDALKKRGGVMSKIILQSKYGEDCDYKSGFDDGEQKGQIFYE